jgi:hypothetical protein
LKCASTRAGSKNPEFCNGGTSHFPLKEVTMSSVLSGKWVGTIKGTNVGAVFAEFAETGDRILGVVLISDPAYGVGVYVVADGDVNSNHIRLVLMPNTDTQMAGHGVVTVLAHMVSPTAFAGEWRSSIGTAGTLSVTKMTTEPTKIMQQPLEMAISNKGGVRAPKRTMVFISYSHHDKEWLERLRVHLTPLERAYAFDIWDDTQIQAGARWIDEIERAIRSAKVGVLIVSADFLASDFIADNELPPLLDAAKKDGAVIMSLIVSPSRFRSTKSLSQFQAVNDPSRPLVNMTRGGQEEILVRVSEEIEAVFR